MIVFLFFLLCSTAFWLFLTLDQVYEQEFSVPLQVKNVPKNVVITTDLPSHIQVVLKDKGSTLVSYRYGARILNPVVIDFTEHLSSSGYVHINSATLKSQVVAAVLSTTSIVSIKPDTLSYYYNYGIAKRVPIRLQGNLPIEPMYDVTMMRFSPDSVTVYAPNTLIDTLTAVYATPAKRDTTKLVADAVLSCTIKKIASAKIEPLTTALQVSVERIVERTIEVPIRTLNFPGGKALRLFPPSVQVTYWATANLSARLTANDFVLRIPYDEVINNSTGKFFISFKRVPAGVSNVKIEPNPVEFIIEDVY